MDIFAEVTLVTTVNNRIYRLSIPWAAPYGELHEVIKGFDTQARELEESAAQIAQQTADKMR